MGGNHKTSITFDKNTINIIKKGRKIEVLYFQSYELSSCSNLSKLKINKGRLISISQTQFSTSIYAQYTARPWATWPQEVLILKIHGFEFCQKSHWFCCFPQSYTDSINFLGQNLKDTLKFRCFARFFI